MLRAASELGYREANVQDVIDRAGVSRPTFYEHFANKEDCFLAAFDTTAARLRERIDAAAGKGGDSLARPAPLRPRDAAALRRQRTGRGAHPDRRGPRRQRRRAAAPRRACSTTSPTASTRRSASCLPERARHSPITAAGIVGGVEALLYSRLNKGETDDLEALLPSLMYFVVLPYEGHEAASEELALGAGLSRAPLPHSGLSPAPRNCAAASS